VKLFLVGETACFLGGRAAKWSEAMKDRIDQGLLTHLDGLGDDEIGDAVVMFSLDEKSLTDAEATARAMLDRASNTTGTAPASVRVLPRLGAMHVSGSGEFLKRLLEDERVYAASRGDI
jgi:hypothetical protein